MIFLLLALFFAAPGPPQWQPAGSGVSASLRGVCVRGNVVWASGSGGTWLRSGDGGKSWWHGVVTGAESLDFRGIEALDDTTAVMFSIGPAEKGQATIWRTADGGAHWREVFHASTPGMFLDAMKFWDRRHGIAVSDPVEGKFAILLTDDGGKSWHKAPREAMPPALPQEGIFAASNSSLAVTGDSEAWFATGLAEKARVFHTSDRGRSWTVVETPVATGSASAGIFSIAFADAKHGVAVGGDYQKPLDAGRNIAFTADGGRTWTLAEVADSIFLSGISLHRGRMLAVGSAGWAYSRDGQQWTMVRHDGFNGVVTSSGVAIAVGAKGAIARMAVDDLFANSQ